VAASSARSTKGGTAGSSGGRWGLVAAAILVQLAIGAVYAWSVFSKAMGEKADSVFEFSKQEAALPFEVAIGTIFIGTFIGGRIQDRVGPRRVALVGGVIYSIGVILASFARDPGQLWLLVLGYGVLGGIGLGTLYITPIAMLVKWFPDKRGLITGLAVGGFGAGALITSPIANRLINADPHVPTKAFLPLGIGYLVAVLLGASFFRNPPTGYTVPGYVPPTTGRVVDSGRDYVLGEALRTPQWYLLTAILALNTTCGIALISQAAQSATDIAGYTTAAAAGVVGTLAFFNGGGRIFWAALSDKIGRMPAFLGMLALQGICFLLLPHATNAALFFVLGAVIYLCYGGGFGTMPATAADYFGPRNAGAIYGAMIVAWSIGGVVGPLVVARLAEGGAYTRAYTTIAVIAFAALVLPLITRLPRTRQSYAEGYAGEVADTSAAGRRS
jgi:OFA family oxalate/formate antiporter-like MFS transporter